MENYIKCFQTCTKCLIFMDFLLAMICFCTIAVYEFRYKPILSDYLLYFKHLFGGISLLLAFILVINSLIGLYALYSKSSHALRVYAVLGTCLTFLSLAFGIIVLLQCDVYRAYYDEKTLCSIDKEFSQISSLYNEADGILCSEACPCDGNVTSINSCSTFTSKNRNNLTLIYLIEEMEEIYECSGMCQLLDRYIFSDFSRGIPQMSCLKAIFKALYHFYIIIGSVFIANSFILAIFVLNSCFLTRKGSGERSYYEKMTSF